MRRFAVAVAASAGAALWLATGALGHLSVTPGVVAEGRAVTLLVELPQLRPGPAPTGLVVSGDGVRELSVAREAGGEPESRWSVRVHVDAPPGALALVLGARFADGSRVDLRHTLTVVPAAGDDGPSAGLVAAGVAAAAAAAAAAALVLRRARRR